MPWRGDRRGAVLVIFSMVLPLILTGIVGLLNLSGIASARAELQSASQAAANAILADLDAALAVSATPDALVTNVDKQARADMIVKSLLQNRQDLSSIATEVTTTDTTISVKVSAQIRSLAENVLWLPFSSSSATTTVTWMRSDQVQIALAIDAGTSTQNPIEVNLRMVAIKLGTNLALNVLSVIPNYPDIAVALVPFTAQVSANPTIIASLNATDGDPFFAHLQQRFALSLDDAVAWVVPRAHAAVSQCYGDPIVPLGSNGLAFGGVANPLPRTCETSIQSIRSLARISRPRVNGKPVAVEPANSPAKIARDDLLKAINAIAPSGCRNLSMGVTWSLAQLPKDNNPKIIFLIANGQNSRGTKGRTSECAGSGSTQKSIAEQLDNEFIEACKLVRDSKQNAGRRLDLVVLQAVVGNPVTLKSCASTTDGEINYFPASSISALAAVFENARTRILKAAILQKKIEKQKDKENGEEDD